MCRRPLRRLIGDESGSTTIETVLWMPFYIFFLTLVFDTTMVFFNQTNILRAIQDANRGYATGQIRTLGETEDMIRASIASLGATPRVSSVQLGSVLRSEVTVRAGDLSSVGLMRRIADIEFTIAAQHFVEG